MPDRGPEVRGLSPAEAIWPMVNFLCTVGQLLEMELGPTSPLEDF